MRCRTIPFLALSLLAASCGGNVGVARKDVGASPPTDSAPSPAESGSSPGLEGGAPRVDATAMAGEPCSLGGYCAGSLKCLAGVCRTICPIPDNECNEKTDECKSDEFCIIDGSFSGACIPGVTQQGAACPEGNCAEGFLCVDFGKLICAALCKYGCPTGTTCRGKTQTGCEVCLPD